MPQDWHASDIAVQNGQILLAHQAGKGEAEDGVYRFDPASGKLTQVHSGVSANQMLLPVGS